jgi:hypothetical protein
MQIAKLLICFFAGISQAAGAISGFADGSGGCFLKDYWGHAGICSLAEIAFLYVNCTVSLLL